MMLIAFFVLSMVLTAQVSKLAQNNVFDVTGQPDSTRPWSTDKGVRSVTYAGDINGNGKVNFVATDYTNGGRVHLLEMNASTNKLEIVWSSPTRPGFASGSTPRWVRVGDLDGDGYKEIIFPLSNGTVDFEVQVWEYQGTGYDFGTEPAITLPANYFAAQGVGLFRTNREVGEVFDFDGDGHDELIMSNRDHNVYVLGISGAFPGFASWQLEGGDPMVHPWNSKKFSVSHWHSIPVNVSGNQKIIVNHNWNNYPMWSIIPNGPDSYRYPDSATQKYYVEFTANTLGDHVAYMGIQRVDVDGDGQDEIAGILYGGNSETYSLALVNFAAADTGFSIWDTTKFGVIASKAWTASGAANGNFWGIGAGDFNGNGREEILLGGGAGYEIMAVEYKGTGDVLSPDSYDTYVFYKEPTINYSWIDVRDSAGVKDTIRTEAPFVSKMTQAFDFNNNGRKEIAASYQSVVDSLRYRYYTYNADSSKYLLDSTVMVNNLNKVNVKYFEATPTGIKARDLTIVGPDDYVLEQNYPNPFNPSTTIRFALPIDKQISLKIYDVLGNEVATLINNQEMVEGKYEYTWNGKNNFGRAVASGMYIAELRFGDFAKTIKMQLLK